MSKFPANDEKFDRIRALKLPLGEYAITSSGPLGIREIRQIGDIDMVVTDELWDRLVSLYPTEDTPIQTKIRLAADIEIFAEKALKAPRSDGPTVSEQLAAAEIIDGIPFISLSHVLYFKEVSGREKDRLDIIAIKGILANSASEPKSA